MPETSNGIECYKMFMRISNYVESLSDEFAFAGSGCGTVQYERDEGAFVLNAYIDIKKDFKNKFSPP